MQTIDSLAQAFLNNIVPFTVVVVLFCLAYFFPTMIANSNKKQNTSAIFALNLFLGWSLIGWVIALVWALTKDPRQAQSS